MFQEQNVSRTFEKIRNNFLDSTNSDSISSNRVTRLGVVTKTIFQLLVVCLFTMIGLYLTQIKIIPSLKNLQDFRILLKSLGFLSIFSFIIYVIGIYFVDAAKICSFLYSMINGLLLGIVFYFLNLQYAFFYPIVFIALFSTVLVFITMAYLYYKNILLVTNSFKQKMFFIFCIVMICQLVQFIMFYIFGDATLMMFFAQSMISIPISIFMIIFVSLILALHFDYLEQMMVNEMPQKYEWQISLGFISLFISIFVRILSLLLRLFGRERD